VTVIAEIEAERLRQMSVEGWSQKHDDEHGKGEMALAAACYAAPVALFRAEVYALDVPGGNRESTGFTRYQPVWPWFAHWWKPKDRRRDLIRAAALIVAEIERLDRAVLKEKTDEA
jgi:hypothetical protein